MKKGDLFFPAGIDDGGGIRDVTGILPQGGSDIVIGRFHFRSGQLQDFLHHR